MEICRKSKCVVVFPTNNLYSYGMLIAEVGKVCALLTTINLWCHPPKYQLSAGYNLLVKPVGE